MPWVDSGPPCPSPWRATLRLSNSAVLRNCPWRCEKLLISELETDATAHYPRIHSFLFPKTRGMNSCGCWPGQIMKGILNGSMQLFHFLPPSPPLYWGTIVCTCSQVDRNGVLVFRSKGSSLPSTVFYGFWEIWVPKNRTCTEIRCNPLVPRQSRNLFPTFFCI